MTSPSWPVSVSPSGLAVLDGRLDEQDVAAGAGHGQAGRDAGDRRALGRLEEELLAAEVLADVVRRRSSPAPSPSPRRDLGRDLAQHLADLALEVADAGLAGVVADDLRGARRR